MTDPATIVEDDIFDDSALDDDSPDEFVHGALADVVTGLLLEAKAPMNVAIFSPWGSGKSSFFTLLRARLKWRSPNTLVVRYDAWKFGGQALKRHFVLDVADQLGLNDGDELTTVLNHSTESSRLRYSRWWRLNWLSLIGAIFFAALAGVAWASLHAWLLAEWLNKPLDWKAAFTQVLPEVGYVMGLVLAAIVFGPKAMEAAVTKTSTPAADTDEQFSDAFSKLVHQALNRHKFRQKLNAQRLVIYIDELDRCEAQDVVQTLTDLKTFLQHDKVIFVVAADRDALVEALRHHGQATPIRVDAPYYSTPGAFIDKVFQHQVTLPPFRPSALSSFATREAQKKKAGVWAELKDPKYGGSDRLFRETIYCLVPAHVRSPRRVKVLLNNFATTARMAQSRGIAWHERAREVAVLTVLTTEFPDVAVAMLRVPQLLRHLRAGRAALAELSEDQRAVVARFVVRSDVDLGAGAGDGLDDEPLTTAEHAKPESPAGAAGAFLGDRDASELRLEQLGQDRLNQQLHAYLRKLEVIGQRGVSDPRRDLLYLRAIGIDEGLTSTTLSDVVDTAADLNPADVIAAFANESAPTSERLIAIALLTRQAQDEEEVQKANLLEVACRLIEALPTRDDVAALRSSVAPEVFAGLDSELWRDEMTPGAIALAAANDNDKVATLLFAKLHLGDVDHNAATQRATVFLDWVSAAVAAAVAKQIAATSQTNATPVIEIVRTCEPAVALKVWRKAKWRVRDNIKALQAVSATPSPAVATGAAGAAGDTTENDTGPNATAVLRELITAALHPARAHDHGKEQRADPPLLSAVLETAQICADPDTTQWVYDNSEQLFGPLADHPYLIRMHIALAIRHGEPEQWSAWLPEWQAAGVVPPQAPDAEAGDAEPDIDDSETSSSSQAVQWASSALGVVIGAMPGLSGEDLDGAIATATALLPTSEPEDYDSVLKDISGALENTGWTADDANCRGALHMLATDLAKSDEAEATDRLVVNDLINGTQLAPTAALHQTLGPLLGALSESASQAFAEHLSAHIPALAAASQLDAMKLRIQAGAQGKMASVALSEFEALPVDTFTVVAPAWLATTPPLNDVLSSLASVSHQPTALATYAKTLSKDQRATLWVAARQAGASYAARSAIGKHGVGSAAIAHIAALVDVEPHQTERSNLVNQLIGQTTLDEEVPHSEATNLALRLFALDNKGDKRSAIRLIAHSGGAADGHKLKIAGLVKTFMRTTDHGTPVTTHGTLYKLELANKPKPATEAAKAILSRIWGTDS